MRWWWIQGSMELLVALVHWHHRPPVSSWWPSVKNIKKLSQTHIFQGTNTCNISHLGKLEHLEKCRGRGYVSFHEDRIMKPLNNKIAKQKWWDSGCPWDFNIINRQNLVMFWLFCFRTGWQKSFGNMEGWKPQSSAHLSTPIAYSYCSTRKISDADVHHIISYEYIWIYMSNPQSQGLVVWMLMKMSPSPLWSQSCWQLRCAKDTTRLNMIPQKYTKLCNTLSGLS